MNHKDAYGEIFVNIIMDKIISLDAETIIPIITDKWNEGTCIIPVEFRIVELNVEAGRRLTLKIAPTQSFKLEDIEVRS